jgi:glycosyltransferase involved in cell wall biosynthesis
MPGQNRSARKPLPLVSIIINNYNYGRYLRHAIESALAQTYPAVETVVVDDGSTDDSVSIVRSYGDRIRPVLKRNGGQGSAFNAGFGTACGELIAFLDADDVFLPEKVARSVKAAADHQAAALIYHRLQRIDGEGLAIGSPFPKRLYGGVIAARVKRSGGTWMYAPTTGQVYRRDFLARIMPVPEANYRTSADAYVACLAGMLEEVVSIPDVLALYRLHGQNAFAYVDATSERQRTEEHNRRYEMDTAGLNAALQRLDRPDRVRLADNFIYQLNQVKCGNGSRSRLAWLLVREHSEWWPRLKTIAANIPGIVRARRARRSSLYETAP